MKDSKPYKTWAFTIRPVGLDDIKFWEKALNKYCNCLEWWGGVEYKIDDDGVKDVTSRHIHLGIVLNKPMVRDVVDKWLVRNLEKSPEYKRREGKAQTNFIKVQKQGLILWYSWDWIANYVQGEWMEDRAPNESDRARIEPLFAPKGDTGLKSTKGTQTCRKTRPTIPDTIVECWHRDYPGKKPMNGSNIIRRYVAYLMYNSKEIPLIKQRDLSDVYVHVAEMITPPEMPIAQECDDAPWFVKGEDDGLVC